jgi:glycosyltransferase involved in cell wall biosynthesis
MKILVNCATLRVGGGLYAGVGFVREALSSEKRFQYEWAFILSEPVYAQLKQLNVPADDFQTLVLDQFPSDWRHYVKIKKKMLEFEWVARPDIIYSIGAPSYVNFKKHEVQRLTNPWITHPNLRAFFTLPFRKIPEILLTIFVQRRFVARCEFFITQTNTSRDGILKLTRTTPWKVKVIPNRMSSLYEDIAREYIKTDKKYIFCLAAPYPHKNLAVIPKVASILAGLTDEKYCFVLTIPFGLELESKIRADIDALGVQDSVLNVGELDQESCAEWYKKSAAVFLPTYLETFSVTLLEALYFDIPVITTDFSFNRDVLGEFGFYFAPGRWKQAAEQIKLAMNCESSRAHTPRMSSADFFHRYGRYSDSFSQTLGFLSLVVSREALPQS